MGSGPRRCLGGSSHARASNGVAWDRSRWDRGLVGRHRNGDGQRLPGHRAGGLDQPGELHAQHHQRRGVQVGRGERDALRGRLVHLGHRRRRAPRRPARSRRNHILAFNAATGSISTVLRAERQRRRVGDRRRAARSLYIGGTFSSVNGVARRGLARSTPTTGAVDTAFNAGLASGNVTEAALVNGRLIISGTFPKKILAVSPPPAPNTGYINVSVTGAVASNAGRGRGLPVRGQPGRHPAGRHRQLHHSRRRRPSTARSCSTWTRRRPR